MLEKYEVCCGLFHGFDWSKWTTGTPQERLGLLPAGAGAHPRAGGRQGPLPARRARAVAGLRAGGAARRGAAHPRRRRLLPGRAGRARQARARRRAARGGARPRGPADRLARRGVRGRGRHLRRRRPRRSPTSRSSPTSSWPRCAACRSATWPWSCCRSCSTARSRRGGARTSCRRAPSPRCWSRRSAATRTAPSRRRR